jgi:hypothetical protein
VAITHVDTHTADAATNSVTVTAPDGISNGDILVAFCFGYGSGVGTNTPGWPSGFTEWTHDHSVTDRCFGLAWKRAASESGNYAMTLTNASVMHGAVSVFRGCLASGDPKDVVPTEQYLGDNKYTTSDTTVRAYAISPSETGLLLWFGFISRDPGCTLAVPSGFTSAATMQGASSGYRSTCGYILSNASGSTGNKDGTASGATSTKHAMMAQVKAAAASGISIPLLNHLLLGD